jgi:hypothetical protein
MEAMDVKKKKKPKGEFKAWRCRNNILYCRYTESLNLCVRRVIWISLLLVQWSASKPPTRGTDCCRPTERGLVHGGKKYAP